VDLSNVGLAFRKTGFQSLKQPCSYCPIRWYVCHRQFATNNGFNNRKTVQGKSKYFCHMIMLQNIN